MAKTKPSEQFINMSKGLPPFYVDNGCSICNDPKCTQGKGSKSVPQLGQLVAQPKQPIFQQVGGGYVEGTTGPAHQDAHDMFTKPLAPLKSFRLMNDESMEFFAPQCYDCENNLHTMYSSGFCCHCGHFQEEHLNHECLLCDPPRMLPCFPFTKKGEIVYNPGATSSPILGTSRASQRRRGLYKFNESSHCVSCDIGISNHYKLPRHSRKRNDIAINFGLDRKLVLYEAAANFYLMLEMKVTPSESTVPPVIDMAFSALVSHLSEQLCLYLELASLGELRHGVWGSVMSERLRAEFEDTDMGALLSYVRSSNTSYNKWPYVKHKLHETAAPDRMAAWSVWSVVKEEFGLDAYLMMSYYFKKPVFRGSVGGEKWAHIIDTAREYRAGNYTPIMFIDTCFGLKHNCNLAFDKFWDVRYVREVLDAVQRGTPQKMSFIEHFASSPIRSLHRKWRLETYGPTEREKEAQQEKGKGTQNA